MARPAVGYTLDGERVPGVTTILGAYKDAGALMHWAWKEGTAGRDYRDTRAAAASAGTLAHAAVEAWIHGREPTWAWDGAPEVLTRAQTAYGAFGEWARQTHLRVEQTEVPLVSRQYRFGGTFDAVLLGPKRVIADWKTSDGTYIDYLMQLAAYGALWTEHHPDQPLDGGYYLLRFDKTHGDFHAHWWAELDDAWTAFRHRRVLYDLDKALRQRVR